MVSGNTAVGTKPEGTGLIPIGLMFRGSKSYYDFGQMESSDAYDCIKIHINRKAGDLAVDNDKTELCG